MTLYKLTIPPPPPLIFWKKGTKIQCDTFPSLRERRKQKPDMDRGRVDWELCRGFMHVALVQDDLTKGSTHPLHKIIWYLFALKHKNRIVVIVYNINDKCFINASQLLLDDTERNRLRRKTLQEKKKKEKSMPFSKLIHFLVTFLAVFP